MSGAFEVLNGDVTVRFEYTADLTKVQTVIGDAAHYLFDNQGGEQSPIAFGDLTNQDKLNLVDAHIKKEIIKLATVYTRSAGETVAREQAEQTAANDYDLGA